MVSGISIDTAHFSLDSLLLHPTGLILRLELIQGCIVDRSSSRNRLDNGGVLAAWKGRFSQPFLFSPFLRATDI